MSNKETKARVANAFRAMKAIGISEDKVKPVLKTLLKLYDKNWELIEEENYRALADAIFERDESEAVEHSKKTANDEAAEPSNQIVNTQETESHVGEEAQVTEDPERPLKRLRRRYQDGQTSSLNTSSSGVAETSLVRPKEEPNELPETHSSKINGSQRILESPQLNAEGIRTRSQALASQSLDKNKGKQPISPKSTETSRNQQNTQLRTESRSQPHPMRLKFRAAVALSSQVPSQEKTPVPESSSHALSLKEPKVEPGLLLSPMRKSTAGHPLIVPKDEPVTGDTLPLDAPIMTVQPGNSNGDSASRNGMICGNGFPEPSTLQSSEREKSDGTVALNEPGNGSELALVSGDCSTTLQIASSPSGEVKISLNCNLARRRPDFHMPSLEAVVKAVDDKCLRSPQTLDLNLSVMNIMKEMCHCFLKLGTDSSNESPETLDVNSAVGSVNRSALNGSVGSPSDANLAMPETPLLLPPCNGVNDESQHNKMYDGDEIVTNKENKKNCNEETNDINLGFVKQPPVTPEIIRSRHDVADIAKGQEKVAITVSNDVNDEFPPSFYYIPQSAPYQNAYVNFSLARIGDNNSCSTCSGDCLSLSVPCACANETGGQFAYTPDGLVKEELLKECISMNRNPTKHCQFFCKECPLERSKCEDIVEPCKGHLVRKFIKECWWKCGCNKQCGNRVVQRGITRNLQVFMTPGGKGWGLRTLEDLPKGAFVCEYVGEILTNSELFDRVSRSPEGEKHSYPVLLDADWRAEGVLKDEEALCLDATYYGNVSRFINHRCYDSTLVEIPVEVETPDHHYYHLAFFTTRKVKAMEELTWDYGIDFDDQEHPIKAFRCQCGSKFCRNIKRSRTRSRR